MATRTKKTGQIDQTITSEEQMEQDTFVSDSETQETLMEDSQISESVISETDSPDAPVPAVAQDKELSVGEIQEEPEQSQMLKIVSLPELKQNVFKASKIIATVVGALLAVALVALSDAASATFKGGQQFRIFTDRFLDYRANEGIAEAVSIVVGEILRESFAKLSVRAKEMISVLPEAQSNSEAQF